MWQVLNWQRGSGNEYENIKKLTETITTTTNNGHILIRKAQLGLCLSRAKDRLGMKLTLVSYKRGLLFPCWPPVLHWHFSDI